MKQKNQILPKKSTTKLILGFFGILAAVSLAFFVNVNNAKADFSADQIQIQVEMKVNGQPGNFVKVGKDGSVSIQVSLTMLSPNVLNVGTDKLDMKSSVVSNRVIKGFGVGLVPKNDPNNKFRCYNSGTSNFTGTGSAKFAVCEPVLNIEDSSTKTVQQGQSGGLFNKTITISSGQFANLGITSTTGFNEFYVYPYLIIDNLYSTALRAEMCVALSLGVCTAFLPKIMDTTIDLAYLPGKSFYTQLFNTQAAANADTTTPPVCTAGQTDNCVPGYGSVTASATLNPGGSPLLGFLNQLLGTIIAMFQYAAFWLVSFIIVPLLEALLQIRTYTDTFAAVIYPGWIIIRNICNMFFIIALIIIAMATLFRVESYQFRHLLVQLIIAALLVNFSLVIAQAVLGFAETIQNQFLPNSGEVIRALARDLMVGNTQTFLSTNAADVGNFADTVKPLFLLAMTLGSAAVFIAITGFMFVRIVALWVLLMLSPAAYAAGALPLTEHWRGQWWSYFLKYAFFTPVMAFFLNITALVSNTQKNNPVLQQITSATFNDSGVAEFAFKLGSNVLLLIFLLAAIKVADGFGVAGADFMSKMVKGGLLAPFGAAKFLGKRAGGFISRRYNEATAKLVTDKHGLASNLKKGAFAVLNPVNFAKGWEHRSEEKKEWAQQMAQGAGQMVASELLTGGKERINYKELALQKIQRNIAGKLRESLGDDPGRAASMDLQRRINEVTGFEGQILRGAAALLTGNQGWGDDTNEVASDTEHDREYWVNELAKRGTNEDGMRLFEQACTTYDDQGFETMQWVYQGLDLNMLARLRNDTNGEMYQRDEHHPNEFADKEFQKFLEKNQMALMNISSLTDGAKKVGHYEQMFLGKKDDRSGLFMPLVDSNWAKQQFEADPDNFEVDKAVRTREIIGEVNKIGIRRFWQDTAWHNLIRKVKKDENGNRVQWNQDGEWGVGDLTDGNSLLQNYLLTRTMAGKKYASQAAHSQARIITNVIGKVFTKDGVFKDEGAKEEYRRMLAKNRDLAEIMTYMQLTGNPPREADFLYDTLRKHGNSPEEFGISPPTVEERAASRGNPSQQGGGNGGN